ncbi:hypothetical protein [Rhodoferax sp.]|uniref:hypothetical protein n=1 Tax=Rhodoferax sp. TaxID=50421 RepID=UPI0027551AA2|nr:hypothetical protein [Rhodoferax sp.]
MKLLNRTFRYFYSTEVMASECQLREDFGDFPPKPLGGNGLPGHFTTVRVRGIGEHIHSAVMMKRLVEGAADVDSLSPTIRNHMADVLALKFFRGPTGIRKKVLMWIGLGAIFLASSLNFIRMTPKGMNSFGFFAPIRREEYEIVIKVRRVATAGLDAASMISHEHIHLLQHKDEHIMAASRNVIWPDDQLFTETARANKILPHLKYILERNEVEARLHELVVSFYRAHKNLPLSAPNFLALLAASKQLGWLVSEKLVLANVDFGPVFSEVVERDKMQARDLEMVLLSMPDELMLRFITEVLPVMYGNLLKYYGDDLVSRKFLSQISRPNFYDELYALSATAPAKCEALSPVTLV